MALVIITRQDWTWTLPIRIFLCIVWRGTRFAVPRDDRERLRRFVIPHHRKIAFPLWSCPQLRDSKFPPISVVVAHFRAPLFALFLSQHHASKKKFAVKNSRIIRKEDRTNFGQFPNAAADRICQNVILCVKAKYSRGTARAKLSVNPFRCLFYIIIVNFTFSVRRLEF